MGVFLLVPGCKARTLDIPGFVADTSVLTIAPVQLPPSYVSAPVAFDLRPVLAELETAVPRRLGSLDREQAIKIVVNNAPDLELAAELTRGPLALSFTGNTVTIASVIAYKARAWTGVLFRHSVSCGTGDTIPRMRLAIRVAYDLMPDWRLKTKSELVRLEPSSNTERDQCEVSAARINITGAVVDKAREAIEAELKRADQRMSRVSVAKSIGGLWATLQRPISISKGMFWLEIQPQAVSLGPISAADSTLTARLDLLAAPRMRSGPRPPDGTAALPPLGRTSADADTTIMAMDGILLYSVAGDILRKKLVGKSITRFRQVRVEDVTVLPAGKGRVVLGIRVGGRLKGTFYVTGEPHYNPSTDLITLPDLAFDVQSSSTLGRFAGWLVSGPILSRIRETAQFGGTALLAEAVSLANKELNRQLSEGVFLRGRLSNATPVNVVATREGLVAQARATGRLWLDISKTNIILTGKQ